MDRPELPCKPAPPTGLDTLDSEHGIQLGLIEASLIALSCGARSALDLVQQLIDYTQAHFLSEQLLMRLAAHVEYQDHIQEHGRLLRQLDQVRERLKSGKPQEAARYLEAHEEDLLKHITSWDMSIEDPAAKDG